MFDPEVLRRACELAYIAQTDLRAARNLHSQGLHPQAIFSLQQAVEKTVKAVGLELRIVQPSELQSVISHRAVKVFVRGMAMWLDALRTLIGREVVEVIVAATPLGEAVRRVEDDPKQFSSADEPSIADLDGWIAEYKGFVEAARESLEGGAAAELIQRMRCEAEKAGHGNVDVTWIPPFLMDCYLALLALYFLAVATLGHAIAPRYGDATRTPHELYRSDNALVLRFDDLSQMLETAHRTVTNALERATRFASR